MSRGMRARTRPQLWGAVWSRIRPQIEKYASAVDVRTMAIQDCAQIRIQDLVAYASRQCLKFSHGPSLPAIEKGESVERTGNGQRLCREAAGLTRRRAAQALDLSGEHRAPARFVGSDRQHQVAIGRSGLGSRDRKSVV